MSRAVKAQATTRREEDLFDKFSDVEFIEKRFFSYVSRYKFSKKEAATIRKALDFASLAHQGQTRDEGTPYIVHPLRISNILMNELAMMKSDLVCSALLHDVVEDCDVSWKELRNNFNETVSDMVKILTKDTSLQNYKKIYFENILNSPDDVKIIKLCDRLDNLRSLRLSNNKSKILRYVAETERKFLPLAQAIQPYLFREMKSEIAYLKKYRN